MLSRSRKLLRFPLFSHTATLWSESEQAQPEIVIPHRQTEQREQRFVSYVQEHGFITNAIYRQ